MTIWTQNIGREMLVTELPVIASLSSLMHGERFLLLSDEPVVVDSLSCQVRRDLFSSSDAIQKMAKFVPASESGVLPFKSQFFDGIVIHHDLEKQSDPRQGLREAVRVLKPGGKLFLIGFNAFSFYVLRSWYSKFVSDDFSEYRFLNPFRLLDWFALLDLELIETPKYGGLGFPISLNLKKENYLTKFRVGALAPNLVRYPFGGIMFMLAQRKDLVRNMNLIKETRVRHLVPAASFRTTS